MHPHLVIALQHIFHLLVLVGGVLHCHALVSITDKETCIQEEEQRVVPVRTIDNYGQTEMEMLVRACCSGEGEWRIN